MSKSQKLPAMQFYPADWRKDPGVQALSFHDRGVWFEILCLMHESNERGVLLLNGRPMPNEALANAIGLDNQILTTTLTTLLTYGVARQREDGALYSKRMVSDEAIRNIRREVGKLGGNPNLVKQKSNQTATTGDNQILTPSSSSSDEDKRENAREHAQAEPDHAPEPLAARQAMQADLLGSTPAPATVAEPAKRKRTSKPKRPVLPPITFDYGDRCFCGLDAEQLAHWQAAFPLVDVTAEVLRASSWVMNTEKTPKANYRSFLNNWIDGEQHKTAAASNAANQRFAAGASNNVRPFTQPASTSRHDERRQTIAGLTTPGGLAESDFAIRPAGAGAPRFVDIPADFDSSENY